jgi:hypothetical protein
VGNKRDKSGIKAGKITYATKLGNYINDIINMKKNPEIFSSWLFEN